MRTYIIIFVSLCVVGIIITTLVPKNNAYFPDNNPITITFNRNTKRLKPESIKFSGRLMNDKGISIDDITARELIKIDVDKENNTLRLSIVDEVPEQLRFNITLPGGSKKQVALKASKQDTEKLPNEPEETDTNTKISEEPKTVKELEGKAVQEPKTGEESPMTDTEMAGGSGKQIPSEIPQIPEQKESTGMELLAEADKNEAKPDVETVGKTDAETIAWPQPRDKIINSHFPDIKNPTPFRLGNGKKVYGQSRGMKVPFQVYKAKISLKSPACVYEFSDEDPVAEMYALWSLGARFLLKDGETTLRLGSENATLSPEIKDDAKKVDNPLIMVTNSSGKRMLDLFCEALGVPSGSISIVLPEEMWTAVYQTVDNVAVESNLKGDISKPDSEVKWRLKNHAESYAIIIQKSDMIKR